MYVIYPAGDLVDESYYALVAQESDINPTSDLVIDPIYHDTSEEVNKAFQFVRVPFEILREGAKENNCEEGTRGYRGRVDAVIKMSASSGAAAVIAAGAPGGTTPQLGLGVMTSESLRDPNGLLLRDLIHPTLTEPLKTQQQTTFKLIKTMSDFTHDLSKIHEQHSDDLQNLVEDYRRRNADFRGERITSSNNSLLTLWESLLQEMEMDSQIHSDIAGIFLRVISRPLLEKTFHMKIQSRKVFTHRESFETVLAKTEEMLIKCHDDYSKSLEYQQEDATPSNNFNLIESHNNYIQQLHASNGMVDQYYKETLPQLLQELDDVYQDVSAVIEEAFAQGTDVISLKSVDTSRRYEGLALLSKNIKPSSDLNAFIKTLNIPDSMTITKHLYSSPNQVTVDHPQPIPLLLRNEIHVDRVSQSSVRNRFENLRKESNELDAQTRQLNDALETLVRIQARSLENQLYNKVNELQEDISLKRFDLRIANLHLAAIHSQKELFATKCEAPLNTVASSSNAAAGLGTPPSSTSGSMAAVNADLLLRERKLSSSSGGTTGGASGGMKNKWVKAFKSIKGSTGKETSTERQKTGNPSAQALLETNHIFQEYTYKKITPCDVCSQILRGHTRQGMKCKLCRLNVHPDCQEKAVKCQPKTRLLRRQKSASELDPRIGHPVDEDIVRKLETRRSPPDIPSSSYDSEPMKYEHSRGSQQEIVISRAPTLDYGSGGSSSQQPFRSSPRYHSGASSSNTLSISGVIKSYIPNSAPHSPQGNHHQKRRLNFRTKSISLDSPESCQIAQASIVGTEARERRRTAGYSVLGTNQRLTAPLQYRRPQIYDYHSPSSPVHSRRPGHLRTTTARMSSVELPDDAEKSVSSASTSPCPSPKPNRFSSANVFIVLYNFKPRHADELDLKAGQMLTVIDTSDKDWWKGKCLGSLGFFPSTYVTKLLPGEKPFQVQQTVQISSLDGTFLKLLRDQIVIRISEENLHRDGTLLIRNSDNVQGHCSIQYLQEI